MKKMIILVGFILLLCGCTAEVNLTVSENDIDEVISINDYSSNKNTILNNYRKYYPVYDRNLDEEMPDEKEKNVLYYDREILDLGNGYNIKYKYKHALKNYHEANTVNIAFNSYYINKDSSSKTITLSTSVGKNNFFIYPSLEKITINIDSDLEVQETNGEKTSTGYRWTYNKNTEQNIYIVYKLPSKEIKKKSEDESQIKKEGKKEDKSNIYVDFINKHPFLVVLIAIIVFFIGVKIITKFGKY